MSRQRGVPLTMTPATTRLERSKTFEGMVVELPEASSDDWLDADVGGAGVVVRLDPGSDRIHWSPRNERVEERRRPVANVVLRIAEAKPVVPVVRKVDVE